MLSKREKCNGERKIKIKPYDRGKNMEEYFIFFNTFDFR